MYEVPLEDGEIRVFPPNDKEGDTSTMYILDVFRTTVQIRLRPEGGVYVHVRDEDRSDPFLVEVNDGGANEYGGDR